MFSPQKIKAVGGNQSAFRDTIRNAPHYNQHYHRKPGYYSDILSKLTVIDPLIIVVDWPSLNFVRRYKGIGLLCESLTVIYDLACCHMKDVWVLSSNSGNMPRALEIAYQALSQGAQAAYAIQLNAELVGGHHDER